MGYGFCEELKIPDIGQVDGIVRTGTGAIRVNKADGRSTSRSMSLVLIVGLGLLVATPRSAPQIVQNVCLRDFIGQQWTVRMRP